MDLVLGQMIVDKTDLVLAGRLPALVHRTYNPIDAFGGIAGFGLGLGQGWALSVDVTLLEVNATLRRLVLPENARFDRVVQPDGSFIETKNAGFAGAVLTNQGGGAHRRRSRSASCGDSPGRFSTASTCSPRRSTATATASRLNGTTAAW